jgi:hypothetical protein
MSPTPGFRDGRSLFPTEPVIITRGSSSETAIVRK